VVDRATISTAPIEVQRQQDLNAIAKEVADWGL
jgi:hypothetical protein